MRESIEALQITLLLTTLLLSLVMLLGFVYTFRLLIAALKQLAQLVNETPSGAKAPPSPVPAPPAPAATVEELKPVSLPRYKCKCNARLPENPKSSRIDGLNTILIYKCGRCGKDTEVNLSTEPVTGDK
jgi:hypothetical protein